MFISNSRRFIFIHITKAAGTSITAALDQSMAWNDLVLGSTPLGVDLQKHYLSRFKLQKHSRAIEVLWVIGKKRWEDYFTFSFVRHPYSRVLSLYTYVQNQVEGKGWKRYLRNIPHLKINRDPVWNWPATTAFLETRNFSEFIRHPNLAWEPGMKPQVDWLHDQDGKMLVDFVGKVENINNDYLEVQQRIGLVPVPLQVLNRSRQPDRGLPVVTEEDYQYLYDTFRIDFETLNYDPDLKIAIELDGV